jgi:hypothetical protein
MEALSAYQMRMRLSATTARMAWSRASSHFSLLSFSTCCSFWRRCPSASASSASFRNSPTAAQHAFSSAGVSGLNLHRGVCLSVKLEMGGAGQNKS